MLGKEIANVVDVPAMQIDARDSGLGSSDKQMIKKDTKGSR